jgi:hypothetical protein
MRRWHNPYDDELDLYRCCDDCDDEYWSTVEEMTENRGLCPRCRPERCEFCGAEHPAGTFAVLSGERMCTACADVWFRTCEWCGEVFATNQEMATHMLRCPRAPWRRDV